MPEEMDQKGGYFFFRSVVRRTRISGLNPQQYILPESDKRWWLIFIVSSEKYQLLLSELCPARYKKWERVRF